MSSSTHKVFICDTETASLAIPEPPASGVVQYAKVEITKRDDVYIEIGNDCQLVNPGVPIDPKAQEVHGISAEMVADKPNLFDVFRIEDPMYFVAHNAKFDLPRLGYGIKHLVGKVCTLEAARRYLTGQPDNKLTTLIQHFGLQMHPAHDALGDCRMTLELLNYILKVSGLTLEQLAKALASPKVPEKVPFGPHRGKAFKDVPISSLRWFQGLTDIEDGLRKAVEMQLRVRGAEV